VEAKGVHVKVGKNNFLFVGYDFKFKAVRGLHHNMIHAAAAADNDADDDCNN
jgi:hypothetical protein